MATITLLKDDGIFTYDDYLRGRAALRIKELNSDVPSQSIRRKSASTDILAVLVRRAWYDARIAAYEAVDAAPFSNLKEIRDDDFMGYNLSLMIDLLRGNAQTPALVSRIANEGITQNDFKVYSLVEKKGFWKDDSTVVPFEESQKIGGDPVAFLLHSNHYNALATAPTATTYTGTGDGTIAPSLRHGGAIAETITITATSATSFTVTGSTSGALGVLTVGTLFESPQITILIEAGGTPFVATDEFVVTSVAAF